MGDKMVKCSNCQAAVIVKDTDSAKLGREPEPDYLECHRRAPQSVAIAVDGAQLVQPDIITVWPPVESSEGCTDGIPIS